MEHDQQVSVSFAGFNEVELITLKEWCGLPLRCLEL